jgi:hypothetical protein
MRGNVMYGRTSPLIATGRPALVTYDKKVTYGKNVIYEKRRINSASHSSQWRVAINGSDRTSQAELG